ncbi:MAG: hypothetical protein F2951_07180 [Actinobacteria bacterium]|uniref:Unannotated protein n=1 Tax=freshwater metagenome TaxID=449393 RepID=A0A6J7VHM6_9ZZZZ|nr:hypothetical protein [Actinomycetota bacterium]MTA68245.1 hypothetical protein [Actinomycetota bacterium]
MTEKKPADDARAKFLEALDKKNQKGGAGSNGGPASGSKVGGGQAEGGAPKRFQRKSGSA